jgi:hypothetical protein
MTATLSDHDLTTLVDSAARGVAASAAAWRGGTPWDEMDAMTQNNVREAALPFIFHGTKALAELGYSKPRVITSAADLDALGQRATVLDADEHIWTNDGDTLDQWGSVTHPESYGGPKWIGSADIPLPATLLHGGI